MKKFILAFLPLLLLVSCVAPTMVGPRADRGVVNQEMQRQYELAVQNILDSKERLYNIGYPILQANADLCEARGFRGKSDGMLIYTPRMFPAQLQPAAKQVLGVNDGEFIITHIFKGYNADEAGIKQGDILRGINGYFFARGNEQAAIKKLDDEYNKSRAVTLHIERSGQQMAVNLPLQPLCDFGVSIEQQDAINAYADSKRIVFTKGMMRFANDQELAIVFGHELAHNLNEHVQAKRANQTVGTLADLLFAVGGVNTKGAFTEAGASAYAQDFEREADYVGLYLTARGGYDIGNAANFWRRMAVEYPSSIKGSYTSSHPAPAERYVNIDAIIREIEQKKVARQPLLPDRALN